MAGLCASVSLASDSPDLDLVAKASQISDLASGSKPFQMEADFVAKLNGLQRGHVTWKFASKDLWSQEFTIGNYHELQIRKGEMLYIKRNVPFTPLKISELQDLLRISKFKPEESNIRRVKHGLVPGMHADCMEIWESKFADFKKTVCLAPTGEIVAAGWKEFGDRHFLQEFASYQTVGEHAYPRELKLSVDESLALQVEVKSLQETSFDASAFAVGNGFIERRKCQGMIYAKPLKTPRSGV